MNRNPIRVAIRLKRDAAHIARRLFTTIATDMS